MTAVLALGSFDAAAVVQTWSIGSPRLLAGLDRSPDSGPLDAERHHATHGPLPDTDLPRLLALLDDAALNGRGGAAFPFAAKLRALRGANPTVLVNGSESEPASRKDRVLLRRTPHLVLDGAIAVAGALGARTVTVAVHDATAARAVRRASAERRGGARVRVVSTSGGFVAGEARALVRALGGGPPRPPGRADRLAARGTLVANTETFAQLAVLLRLGARRFAESGTPDEPGTMLLTVGGAVQRRGVVEIPLGTPLGIVLSAAQAEQTRAVVVGGYHGSWLPVDRDLRLSGRGMASAGATLGAGVLLALDATTCPLGELTRVTAWLAGESARQCGPCMFGLAALAADIGALYRGDPSAAARALRHAGVVNGRGACKHPDGTARFVSSGLALLGTEIELHQQGGCGRPVLGQLPLGEPR